MRKTTLTGLCLLLALPALGQRGGGFGGGIGFGRGAVGRAGFGRGAVIGFGTPGTFGAGFGTPGAFGAFGTPGAFGAFGSPFGFGTGVFGRFRSPFVVGFGTPQNFLNVGVPPLGGSLPSLGLNAPGSAFFRGLLAEDTFPGWSLPYYPYAYGGYGYGYDMAQPPSPSVIVIQPVTPEMMQPPKPPEPARLVISEFKPATTAEAQPAPAAPLTRQQMFSIALTNGTTDSATAAWVQDNCLYYLNANGKREQIALNRIDRSTTERLNRDKNLSLWLPPQ